MWLDKFSVEKVIEFILFDGEFEFVKYCVLDNITFSFKFMFVVKEFGRTRLVVIVNLCLFYGFMIVVNEIKVWIFVFKFIVWVMINVSGGKVKYVFEEGCFRWKIKKCVGYEEY